MNVRRTAIALIALAIFPSLARSQSAIGEVAIAEKLVIGAYGGKSGPLKRGESVVQNEQVSTGADSAARIAFHDLTTIALGPEATIKLDRFVYNPDSTGRTVSVAMAKGAFRFITGNTASKNIAIKTPSATIGVRGTVIDVLVTGSREIVVLREGAAFACRGATCRDVVQPGTGFIITPAGIEGPTARAAAEFDFDQITRNRFYLYGNAGQSTQTGYGGSPANSNPPSSSSHSLQ